MEPEPEPEPECSSAIVEWKPTKLNDFLTSLHRESFTETVQFASDGVALPRSADLRFAQGGTGTGALQWGSGRLLTHFMARHPQLAPLRALGGGGGGGSQREVVPKGWGWRSQSVIELGAGLGLVATVVAMLGGDIVTTDGVEDLIEQLQRNVDLNLGRQQEEDGEEGGTVADSAGAAVAMLLPWGDESCTASVQKQMTELAAARGNTVPAPLTSVLMVDLATGVCFVLCIETTRLFCIDDH